MLLTLVAILIVSVIEQGVWLLTDHTLKVILVLIVSVSLAISSCSLVLFRPGVWSLLILFFSVYRIVNLLRIIENRMQTDYLRRVGRRCSWFLIGSQLLLLIGVSYSNYAHIHEASWLSLLAILQLLSALALLGTTNRQLRTTKPPLLRESYADRDLPTLTVAIPARNETDDLEACLTTLVATTYPKLEIIVLDDCSQNKRTPEIIRGFAHDGVRFIAGTPAPDNWLAKNFAYQQLFDEANGELLLFCGVDARFQPDSLRVIVETLLEKKKTVLSWLPRNRAPHVMQLEALLVQPSRYGWELSLPRRLFNRAPVLSTCWIIKRTILKDAGTFKAVTRSIRPESYFARYAAQHDDGYSFLQSNSQAGIDSVKSIPEQRATAIRTRYPQLHRRIELVALITLAECGLFLGPFIGVLLGLYHQSWSTLILSCLACLSLSILYARLAQLTYRQLLLRGLWLFPFAMLYDICLLNYSLWKYEFDEVIWKGRNVCIPIMRIIPAFPKLP